MKAARTYLWISRWEDFQHYKPERDRAPAWIKTYTKQLDDQTYLDLTGAQRGLLHDLRAAFSRAHGKLSADHRQLTHRVGMRVTQNQLELLNHAGYIEFLSREVLEHRLEVLYASRAPARSHRSEKGEGDRENRLAVNGSQHPGRNGDEANSEPDSFGNLNPREEVPW